MNKLCLYLLLLLSSLLFTHAHARAQAQPAQPWTGMSVVGQAKLRVAIWDVYNAELFSESGRFSADKPFALRLTYLRDISQEALIDETKKQWRQTTRLDAKTIESWARQLQAVLPGVNRNDSITLFIDHQQHAHFYLNDEFTGQINEAAFAKYFSGIWLAPETTRPELRKQLLGLL